MPNPCPVSLLSPILSGATILMRGQTCFWRTRVHENNLRNFASNPCPVSLLHRLLPFGVMTSMREQTCFWRTRVRGNNLHNAAPNPCPVSLLRRIPFGVMISMRELFFFVRAYAKISCTFHAQSMPSIALAPHPVWSHHFDARTHLFWCARVCDNTLHNSAPSPDARTNSFLAYARTRAQLCTQSMPKAALASHPVWSHDFDAITNLFLAYSRTRT